MNNELQIRSSAAEFLIFQTQEQSNGIQVYYKNETVWLSQKAMATLFDCSTDNIGLHLKNIYEAGELSKEATTEIFSAVQKEGEQNALRCSRTYRGRTDCGES